MLFLYYAIFLLGLCLLIALIPFVRNPKSPVSQNLVVLILFSALWAATVSLDFIVTNMILLFFRLAFVSALLMVYSMYRFALSVVAGKHMWGGPRLVLGLILVLVLAVTPYVTRDVNVSGGPGDMILEPDRGVLYLLYVATILYLNALTFRVLRQGYLETKSELKRRQLKMIFWALAAGATTGLTTNILLPNIVGTSTPSRFAFLTPVIWTIPFVYAITRQKLFDLKVLAIRALGYSLLVSSLVFLYVGLVLVLTGSIFGDEVSLLANSRRFWSIPVIALESVLLFAAAAINLALGALIFIRDPRSRVGQYFLGMTVGVVGWAATNALFNDANERWFELLAGLSYTAGTVMIIFFYLLVRQMVGGLGRVSDRWHLLVAVIVAILSAVPGILFSGVNSMGEVISLPLVYAFITYIASYVLSIMFMLAIQYRRSSGVKKNQAKTILYGFVLAAIAGMTFNLLIPVVFNNFSFVNYGPLGSIIFIFSAAAAISKHRLFDIHTMTARSVLYTAVALVAGSLYVLLVIGTSGSVFRGEPVSFVQQVLLMGIGALLVLSFKPLKMVMDRATDRVFHRHGYDSQAALNELSTLLANEYDLRKTVRGSTKLIARKIQPTHARLIVFDSGKEILYQYSTNNATKLTRVDPGRVKNLILINQHNSSEQSEWMNKDDLEIVLRLENKHEVVGVLLVGPKQTGSSYTRQDINLLKISSNNLALALQNARYYEEISRFADKLQEEVDAATAKLRKANRDLKALNKSKDEFMSMMSHQLRPQLTAARGFLAMINSGEANTQKERRELSDLAGRSLDRMARVLSDILNTTRLQEGKFSIFTEETDFAELVRSEVEGFQTAASKKGIKLRFNSSHKKLVMALDWVKIREGIFNFLDNALQYSPENSEVKVGLTANKERVELTVVDQGMGVPKKAQKKLFTKFFRADNARNIRPSGTGVGLFVTRQVIRAHGGRIIFESEEGKGSTFGFWLPRTPHSNR